MWADPLLMWEYIDNCRSYWYTMQAERRSLESLVRGQAPEDATSCVVEVDLSARTGLVRFTVP